MSFLSGVLENFSKSFITEMLVAGATAVAVVGSFGAAIPAMIAAAPTLFATNCVGVGVDAACEVAQNELEMPPFIGKTISGLTRLALAPDPTEAATA